jgi:hypothetical protein
VRGHRNAAASSPVASAVGTEPRERQGTFTSMRSSAGASRRQATLWGWPAKDAACSTTCLVGKPPLAARASRSAAGPRDASFSGSASTGAGTGDAVAPGAGHMATSCQSARWSSRPREVARRRFAPGELRLPRTTSPHPKPTFLRRHAAQAGRPTSPGRRWRPGRFGGLGRSAIPGTRRSGPRRPGRRWPRRRPTAGR